MGKRLFQHWFLHPLKSASAIKERQNAVGLLKEHASIQKDLKIILNRIPDIEKNISRISSGYTHPKER
jgi:DNA mismatch repair protein MutS